VIHRLSVRVYWEDTDAGGIVYHSNYLNFAERARTEMVRGAGLQQSELAAGGTGQAFAVRRVEIDFQHPARLDDLLTICTQVTDLGGASMTLNQWIERQDGVLLARLVVKLAFIGLQDGKPARIPAELKAALRGLLEERVL